MEKVGLWGVEPARLIGVIVATLMIIKKLVAPAWLTEDNISAINDYLLIVLPFVLGEATRQLVYAKGKVDAVVSTQTQQQIANVTSSTPKAPVWLIAVIAGGLTLSACSLPLKQRVVTGYQSSAIAVEAIHNVETEVFRAGVLQKLTPNAQDQILGIIDKTIAIQERAGLAIVAWKPGQPVPQDVLDWFTAAGNMLPEIEKVIPELGPRLRQAQAVIVWARALVEIAQLFRIQVPTNVSALALAEAR